MTKILFYCQHILGMGHFVRSMEIVRGLVSDFQVCFINGGEVIQGFDVPADVEIINLPAIKTDAEFRSLQAVDSTQDLAAVQESRTQQLLKIFEQFQPDILMVELFPFGRRKFSFELIPLLERVKAGGKTKVVCSLRDIVVTKQNKQKHEEKVCQLMNQYFDLLLIHGDPWFQPLEETFSRIHDLTCDIHYTGYIVQPQPSSDISVQKPMILVSVGGGRFGHELLDCVIDTAPILSKVIRHKIQIYTGPFMPDYKFLELQDKGQICENIRLERYTSNFLSYMKNADLSISMSGYNTTMNILTTGVRGMLLPFMGNDDQEQRIRAEKLEKLGVIDMIHTEELQPEPFAQKIIHCLQKQPTQISFDFNGVEKTARLLKQLITEHKVA